MTNSKESLLIKYEGDGFNLGLLGESFSGLDNVFKDLCDMSGIQGEIQIKTTRIEYGSVDVYNVIHFILTTNPFSSPHDLFEFLKIASPDLLGHAHTYFSELGQVHRDLNSYFKENQFDNSVLSSLLGAFIVRAFDWAGKLKKRPNPRDDRLGEISAKQADKLRSMVLNGKYKRIFKPITEGNISGIKLSSIAQTTPSTVEVSDSNVGEYLPDDATILPELENGSIHCFTGELVALQSTKGEVLKIKVDDIDPLNNLLTVHPGDGKNTEDYKDFYKQGILFTAEVVRLSMYKRPDLVIKSISLLQERLI